MNFERMIARPMLMLHAISGCAALAISIHVLYFIWRGGMKRGAARRARARRYAAIAWPVYLAALLTGAFAYPAYMVDVRWAYLEESRPFMVGLFEIKEHWGAIGLLLAWGVWRYLCRSTPEEIASADQTFWRGHALLTSLLVICAAVNVIVGFWVVMVRSV